MAQFSGDGLDIPLRSLMGHDSSISDRCDSSLQIPRPILAAVKLRSNPGIPMPKLLHADVGSQQCMCYRCTKVFGKTVSKAFMRSEIDDVLLLDDIARNRI